MKKHAEETGLKNRWLVKRYYVKSVTELLLSMRVAFSPLKISIWRTGCSCFSTGTAILFHFQRTIEVTLDSFLIGNAVWIDHWLQWLSKKPFWPPYTGETEYTYRQSNFGSNCIFWSISLFKILSSVNTFSWTRHAEEGWSHGCRSVIYWCTIS